MVESTDLHANLLESIAAVRPQLVAFARLQVRSSELAEDLVQDTLVSAIDRRTSFTGAAALNTWLFAILKNKIIDEFRRAERKPTEALPAEQEDPLLAELFDNHGHWTEFPAVWGDPHACLEQTRFWQIMDACLTQLPASCARVFMMREFLELDTDSICKELEISTSNCYVLLHRARLGLRECLEINWFGVKR